jgi:hypothetical protein
MKKQLIKIMVLSITCLTLSIGVKAQHYEGGTSENYEEEAVDNSFDYAPSTNTIQGAVMMSQQAKYSNSQNDEPATFVGSIAYPSSNMSRSANGVNGSELGGIPDPLPDTPIDSNLYVLFLAALCYGYYKRKRMLSIVAKS